jgi:PBSX family phage portal protein
VARKSDNKSLVRVKSTVLSPTVVDRPTLVGRMTQPTADMVPRAKAHFVGQGNSIESNALAEGGKAETVFQKAGALVPPYEPALLTLIYENSSALRPNIDSYVTNIDSFGHHFKPVIDLDANNADVLIAAAMRTGRKKSKTGAKKTKFSLEQLSKADDATPAEVAKEKERLREEMRDEAERLELFFQGCTFDIPFSGPEGLRGLTRMDIETIGGGYWEVLRNDVGGIIGFNRLPSISMRLMPLDDTATAVKLRRKVSLLEWEEVPAKKRFRRFVQQSESGGKFVFFKEFGDPRVISTKTGKAYEDVETMKENEQEKGAKPATEVIFFKVSSPRSAYGIPRWIGTLLAVMGSRQAEEVNFLYFENRSIPPMAIMVSGGRLNEETVKRLEDYIDTEIKGKHNFHKILILEAEAAGAGAGYGSPSDVDSGRMKIQLTPLTAHQQQDATFQGYDERNADKIGQAFRLPRLLRGDVRDFNRSTAEASVDFAEIQVFGPIRQQFDWLMNQLVLPELGVKYHTFESNAPTVRDPIGLGELITKLVTANVLTPGEGRDLAAGVFNREFEKLDAYWTQQPIALTVAGRSVPDNLHTPGVNEADRYDDGLDEFSAAGGMSAAGAGPTQQALGVSNKARALTKLHQKMLEEERSEFQEMQKEIVKVPTDIFLQFFASVPAVAPAAPEPSK